MIARCKTTKRDGINVFRRMGELEPWMDENFIKGVFLSTSGETVNVKVIRDKNSGYVLWPELGERGVNPGLPAS